MIDLHHHFDGAFETEALYREARRRNGKVDGEVARCAGELIAPLSEDDIDLLVDVNLRAVLHLCRLVVPGMVARDRGHVVNISSIAAAYNFNGNSTYHATKAAVSMLSRQLRIDAEGGTRWSWRP